MPKRLLCLYIIFGMRTIGNDSPKGLSIHLNQVQCTLMGDLRHIRNVIIHEDAVIPQDFSDKLELLPQIWSLEPGELRITEQMVHSLMEQINALRIQIDTNKPSSSK